MGEQGQLERPQTEMSNGQDQHHIPQVEKTAEQEQIQKPLTEATGEQEEPHKPQAVTYGDVFPDLEDKSLAAEAVTMEDASMMQCAETIAFGHTHKGGAASAMQSAASRNVDSHAIDKDAHSSVANTGVTVSETAIPGAVADISYVGDEVVYATAHPTPTLPGLAPMDAITIGEALEIAAVGGIDRPIDESDARAIMSAEARATGSTKPLKGGLAAAAQSASAWNTRNPDGDHATVADVLMDATSNLPLDKVVTHEDALKVLEAEGRNQPGSDGNIREGGIGAALAVAAIMNEADGFVESSQEEGTHQHNQELATGVEEIKEGIPPPSATSSANLYNELQNFLKLSLDQSPSSDLSELTGLTEKIPSPTPASEKFPASTPESEDTTTPTPTPAPEKIPASEEFPASEKIPASEKTSGLEKLPSAEFGARIL